MKATNHTRRYYVLTLAVRTAAFLLLLFYAVYAPEAFAADLTDGPFHITPLTIVWAALMLSMLFRFFPSRLESLGCQKEFSVRFRSTGRSPSAQERRKAGFGTLWVLLSWIGLNALFFLAHWKGWVGDLFMVCLTAFYGVCDIICILFFCPFQAWMMHNRCCTTCRIYNWDYLMMCTPLLCIPRLLPAVACVVALALFLRWEITYYRRKERFFESSNDALRCSQCQEQLCKYKRALSAHSRPHRK